MEKSNPVVSVVVPIYNLEPYLAQCLDSLLSQTLSDIEVVCVDDGSTDGSADVLARYSAEDERLRVVRQENAGPGSARNRALAEVRGEFVYCFDGDDFCDASLLEEAVEKAREFDADLVVMPFCLYNNQVGVALPVEWSLRRDRYPEGSFTWRDNPDELFETFHNYPWNKLVRTKFLREKNIRFLDIYLTEDLAYSAAALVEASSIACTDEPRIYHREGISTNSMSEKHKHPFDFITAFRDCARYLDAKGVFDDLRVSFVRWAAHAVSYNLTTLRNEESFLEVFYRLRDTGLDEMRLPADSVSLIRDEYDARVVDSIRTGEPLDLLFRLYADARPEADLAVYRSLVEFRISGQLRHDLAQANERIGALERQVEDQHRAYEALAQDYEKLDRIHTEIMNAAEQKVGQVVCAIPRAVQRAVLDRKGK